MRQRIERALGIDMVQSGLRPFAYLCAAGSVAAIASFALLCWIAARH